MRLLLRRLDGEFHKSAFVQRQFEVQLFDIAGAWKFEGKVAGPWDWKRTPDIPAFLICRLQQRQVHSLQGRVGISEDEDSDEFIPVL